MFFKNVLSYSLVNFYAQVVRFVQELVVRFLLAPEVLGVWSLVLLIQSLGLTLDAGVMTASSRELPLLYGAKQYDNAANYRRTAFYLHIIAKAFVALGICIYALLRYAHLGQGEWVALVAASVIVVVASVGEALIAFYQTTQDYVVLSKKLFVYWSCYAPLLILGAYFFAVKGLIIALLLSLILQACVLRQGLHFQGKGQFKTTLIKPILGFAIPFRLTDLPMSLIGLLDGLFVARFFGLKTLAIYMTAKLVFNQAGQIPVWMNNVFIIRMTTLLGDVKQRANVGKELLMNLTVLNLIILPLIIGLVSLMTYWGVLLFLPKYVESLSVLPILLLSLYFQPRVTVIRNYWIIEKKFKKLVLSNIFGMSLMLLGFLWLYFLKIKSLFAVGMVFTLSFGGYFLFIAVQLGIQLWGGRRISLFFIELAAALVLLVLAMRFSGLMTLVSPDEVDWMMILGSFIRFFGVMMPLILYGVWGLLRHKIILHPALLN